MRMKLPAGSVQTPKSLITTYKLTVQLLTCRMISGLTRLTMLRHSNGFGPSLRSELLKPSRLINTPTGAEKMIAVNTTRPS
ncbi:MAG: hypothetical protein ABSB89_04665 [Candidatus Bathyarchaeia archaeon]